MELKQHHMLHLICKLRMLISIAFQHINCSAQQELVVLYGKEEILNELPPYQGGGEMIKEVSFEKTTYACLPHKFEAGTPNISGVIAFKQAIDFITDLGVSEIAKYEEELLKYATD